MENIVSMDWESGQSALDAKAQQIEKDEQDIKKYGMTWAEVCQFHEIRKRYGKQDSDGHARLSGAYGFYNAAFLAGTVYGLMPSEFLVLLYLVKCAWHQPFNPNRDPETGKDRLTRYCECNPSRQRISRDTLVCERQVSAIMSGLESKGLIRRKRRFNATTITTVRFPHAGAIPMDEPPPEYV